VAYFHPQHAAFTNCSLPFISFCSINGSYSVSGLIVVVMKAQATKKSSSFWAVRHFERPTVTTLVTTGASHLNRVELQNGCMALADAYLFISSTLS